MNDLKVRIVRELARGPLVFSVISSRLKTVPVDELADALGEMTSAKQIERKGLRYYAIEGTAIAHEQPTGVLTPVRKPQHDEGETMTTRTCNTCAKDLPIDDFPKNKQCVGGHTRKCRTCTKAARGGKKTQTSAKNGGGTPKTRKLKKKPTAARAKQKSDDRLTIPSSHSIECVVDRYNGGIAGIELSTESGAGILQLDVGQARNLRDWLTRLDLG